MDKANNSVGIEIGTKVGKGTHSNSDILKLILDAGKKGKLTVISTSKNNEIVTEKVNLSDKKHSLEEYLINKVIRIIKEYEKQEEANNRSNSSHH